MRLQHLTARELAAVARSASAGKLARVWAEQDRRGIPRTTVGHVVKGSRGRRVV